MLNYYYKDSIQDFISKSNEEIIGNISLSNQFDSTLYQNKAWHQQINILKANLKTFEGYIYFEFSIPRMGKRVDCILIIKNITYVIEFKVGETQFHQHQVDQVWDYALDLKNFHKPSHHALLVPILIATESKLSMINLSFTSHNDNLLLPIKVSKDHLSEAINKSFQFVSYSENVDPELFEKGSYTPTPTIIEAAISLYNNHSVEEITRSDAEAINLTETTDTITSIIEYSKKNNKKSICFVTGVPGAGKTLVGLKIATTELNVERNNASVYLSGNAPLVAILQEALTRNRKQILAKQGITSTKQAIKQAVKSFIQIIHHYRDEYLRIKEAPYDHIAIFDEAQRAWDKEHTVKFMRQKKNQPDFDYSEPEFLISCLDRHKDWAVIICLVGSGQEINSGEAGISEWLKAIDSKFDHWSVYISPVLLRDEYSAKESINSLKNKSLVTFKDSLHLAVSLRSYRAENLSLFVKNLLDLNIDECQKIFNSISKEYPIILTRQLSKAKAWLKEKARGSERYGLIVSSQAQRLKPYAIDVKSPIDPVNWFLNSKDDVRSSYYLEDVATEFHIQGLELDWVCVNWDADLRYSNNEWKTFSFKGNKWQNINSTERKKYLINSYRVLLTRARQGMIIVVPEGDIEDHTRNTEYYDPTFEYLKRIGIPVLN